MLCVAINQAGKQRPHLLNSAQDVLVFVVTGQTKLLVLGGWFGAWS